MQTIFKKLVSIDADDYTKTYFYSQDIKIEFKYI